jgi:class 3 adenylate cyclase/tetratricopeptide (TPR) repeat protein
MENELICESCSHKNRTSARFCAACGSSLEKQCPKCMKVLSATANYCDGCGTKIKDEATLQSSESTESTDATLERRQMTVMFCDLRDSTHLSEQLDPEDLRLVLRLYQDSCTSVIQKYGGYVSRYMGDGILALFGYPNAHEDDAYRAVRASLDIVGEITSLPIDVSGVALQLAVRVGIATGVVISGEVIGKQASREQSIVGQTPNLAARLQSIADTNNILVNETTYRLVRNRVDFEFLGPMELHGISKPANAYRVNELLGPAQTPVDDLDFPTSAMVGRETELGHLIQQWGQAKKSTGRVVLIQGEAGIGKTRLIQEIKTSIDRRSHNVLEMRCSSHLTNNALHPVFELFRENVETGLPELAQRISEKNEKQASRLRSLVATVSSAENVSSGAATPGTNPTGLPFDAIIQLLVVVSEDKPLFLVLEDFQWADPSTVKVIDLLVDQIPLERILLVISSRPESGPQWLTRSHATQLTLDRLNPEDAEVMFLTHARNSLMVESLCQIVVNKSDGVPLFLEELTKSILSEQAIQLRKDNNESAYDWEHLDIPETLRDSLMARLDQLGESKTIAQLGSAIGRDFDYALLREITNLSEARLSVLLSRLVSSELVFQRGGGPSRRYHFKHALIQETAYESLVRPKRTEFHQRIASALEKLTPEIGRSQPELMARHYALSGQTAEAVDHWNLAAERALQQSANLEAIHHASEGIRHVTDLDDEQRRDELLLSLYIHLSTAISGTKGDAVPEVEDIHQKAAILLNRSGNSTLAFSLTREMHAYYLIRGPLERAVELGHQMLELAQEIDDPKTMTESWRCLGWTYICHGEQEKGQALVRKSLSHYDIENSRDHTRHDTIDPGGVGMINLAWSEWLAGNSDTAAGLARDAVAQSRKIDHPYTLAYAICMGAAVFQCRRKADTVLSMVDEAISIAKERDYRYWIAWGSCLQGWAQAQLGNPEIGIQSLTDGLKEYRGTGATLFVPHILCMTAESLCLMGNHAEARRHLKLAAEIESDNHIYFYSAETQRLLATVESELGETESSITHFQKALDMAQTQKARNFELRIALSIMQSPSSSLIVPDAQKTLAFALNNLGEGQGDADHQTARDLVISG